MWLGAPDFSGVLKAKEEKAVEGVRRVAHADLVRISLSGPADGPGAPPRPSALRPGTEHRVLG